MSEPETEAEDRSSQAPDPEAPAVHDPAAFRLRGALPRVTRLSRKALAIAGIVAGTAIGGALIYALHQGPPVAPSDNLYTSHSAARAGVVTEAPADWP